MTTFALAELTHIQYNNVLVEMGAKSVEWLLELSQADLSAIGIKPLHIRKIMRCLSQVNSAGGL